jgi:hypothetical protein
MKRSSLMKIVVTTLILCTVLPSFSQKSAPLNPVDQGSWILAVDAGPATHIFGNGWGFGPGIKLFFENGTWQLGPGVLSLGGDVGFSIFSYKWGDGYHETWVNYMFGARTAYHYGWDVKGLDTYAGIPLGIGFSVHTYDDFVGYKGYSPIFPYLGFFAGASYFFNNHIGINGEIGYNVTYANLGVIFKLR